MELICYVLVRIGRGCPSLCCGLHGSWSSLGWPGSSLRRRVEEGEESEASKQKLSCEKWWLESELGRVKLKDLLNFRNQATDKSFLSWLAFNIIYTRLPGVRPWVTVPHCTWHARALARDNAHRSRDCAFVSRATTTYVMIISTKCCHLTFRHANLTPCAVLQQHNITPYTGSHLIIGSHISQIWPMSPAHLPTSAPTRFRELNTAYDCCQLKGRYKNSLTYTSSVVVRFHLPT